MKNIIQNINKYVNQLQEMKQEVESKLLQMPEGGLRSTTTRGKPRFYWTIKGKKQVYLNAKNDELKKLLAQKSYYKDLQKTIDLQIKSLDKILENKDLFPISDVFYSLPPCRQELVTPIQITDEQFAMEWLNQSFTSNPYPFADDSLKTDRGEIVRSKTEKFIADKLNKLNIPYRYEQELYLEYTREVVYPDFTILNKKTRKIYYLEHLGMMGDPSYSRKSINKIKKYVKNNIIPGKDLILTFETDDVIIDTSNLDRIIDSFFGENSIEV